jgi:Rad3-related DNA helicase
MDFYPYDVPRIGHREALETIEKLWESFDVAMLISPMGSGKTGLRRAIAYWAGDVAMTVPVNSLILQEMREFPETQKIMKRADFYEHDDDYDLDLTNAKIRGRPILCVPHMLIAHKLNRRVLIADEGHKMIQLNQELQSIHAWRRKVGFPITTYSREQFETFLKTNPMAHNRDKLLKKIQTNDYMVKREHASYRNSSLDRLRLIPLSPPLHPTLSRGTDKIILMSATLSDEDIRDLGVGRNKRILKIEVPSPIPPENRPLVRSYVGALSYSNLNSMGPMLARRIADIANFHEGKKGIVHATYGMATILRRYLTDVRFIFHDQDSDNKKDMLEEWMDTEDGVFIASGCEEGLNLAGPEYEFQIISKLPWPSLADVAIRKRAGESQAWYLWQCLRMVMQAYGRICRGPTDEGTTYVLDSTFDRLINQSSKCGLIPEWFKKVL